MAKYSECMSEASEPKKKGKVSAKMLMLKNMIKNRKSKGKKASKYATALA